MVGTGKAYNVYNLNWVVTVDNRAGIPAKIDEYSATSKIMSDALTLLKTLFVGPNGDLLLSTTTKLLPLKDYILSRFDYQFQAALNEHIVNIFAQGNFENALRENTILFDEDSFKIFDIVFPSKLTLDQRTKPAPEFYILPIKMVTSDLSDKTISMIISLFEDETEIKNIVAALKSTDFFQELSLRSGPSTALTPLIADAALSSLRGIVSQIRRIQGVKSGKNY